MTDTDGKEARARSMREALAARLLGSTGGRLPTSLLARFGKAALAGLRGRKLFRGGDPGELDITEIARLVGSLGELKGIAMKIGQIMSYIDVAVPDELRAALSALQTASPPMPFDVVRAIVLADLGERAPALLSRMEPAPVAAASIGQVHRAALPDGTCVAVKVRYPDIDKAIAADFAPAALGGVLASAIYPGAKVDAMIHELRERLLAECDYAEEARAQARFFALYAGHPVIVVPAVFADLCAARVLSTAWIEGASFDAYLASDPPGDERDRVGEALFEFYIGTLFRHGLYNCDPHPGNYLFPGGGRVAMLDYGCTRAFSPDFLAKLAGLTRAVHEDTREALHAAFVDLGMVREGKKYDFDSARSLVRGFFGPMLRDEVLAVPPGEAKGMREIFEDKRALMRLTLPGEFLFLFRIRFGLMSVLARLGARVNWFRLEERFVQRRADPGVGGPVGELDDKIILPSP